MAATTKAEQDATLKKIGPRDGERVVGYRLFVADYFVGPKGNLMEYPDDPSAPTQIDGYLNDDSYRSSRHLVRRPGAADSSAAEMLRENSLARQIMGKKDQPATIRLIRRVKQSEMDADDTPDKGKPWKNLIPPNTKFFLEQVQENREEKVQVIDTFGEWVAFFFGRRPEVYTYTGTLLNSKNHDWKNEFQENYEHFLRGSQAVKNRATMLLQYDDVLVEGYMMGCSIAQDSTVDTSVGFRFNLLVVNRSPLNPRGMMFRRYQRSGLSELEYQLFQNMNQALNLKASGRLDELETFLVMREFFAGNYFAAAGKVNHKTDYGALEETTSTKPGQKGGIIDEGLKSASFDPVLSGKVAASGANGTT